MCKDFRVIKSTSVETVESIGGLYHWTKDGQEKGCITNDVAENMYRQLLGKASFVRFRKRLTEIII